MKKTLLLTLLVSTCFLVQAQQQNNQDISKGREKLEKGIRKEKFRKPVKIEDALHAEAKKSLLKTTNVSTEKKVSNISAAATEEGEAFIAIDPQNPAKLVMSYMEQSVGLSFPIYYSNDSGNTWTKSSFNTLSALNQDLPGGFVAGGGDPVFAYDKNGKLYFSWIYLAVNQMQDSVFIMMYWASSTNNGQTWTLAQGNSHFIGKGILDAITQSFISAEGFFDRQWFCVDRSNGNHSGRLYTSFLYIPTPFESPTDLGTWIKTLDTGATAWSARTQVYSGTSQFANPVVDKNGVLHLTFADVDMQQVYHISSTNGGQSFSTPNLIYNGFNLFPQSSMPHLHDRENAAVNLAVDSSNILHAVWSDFDVPMDGYRSFYSRSTNGGQSWSTPLNIGTLLPNGLKSLMPVVSTFNDKVTLGMYGVDVNSISDYYIITSVNNGQTWDTARRVSTLTTDFSSASNAGKWFGDYFNSVRTDCKVYNIWSDGRGSNGTKMYLSVTRQCNNTAVDVAELTPVNGSFSVKNIFPNPASDRINLDLTSEQNGNLNCKVLQLDGKVLSTELKTIQKGTQSISLNIDKLPAGNYLLMLESKDGYKYSRLFQKL